MINRIVTIEIPKRVPGFSRTRRIYSMPASPVVFPPGFCQGPPSAVATVEGSCMSPIAIVLLAPMLAAAPAVRSFPFEISSNKPFVQTTVNGSTPQWFIFDTGCRGASIVARECADRLKLARGAEERADVGAGTGTRVGLSTATGVVRLAALGETLSVAQPILLTLEHVARVEGRRVDGLIGQDFLMRHVVEIDYASRRITVRDPGTYTPPADGTIVPVDLETGWPVAEATITTPG